MSRIPTAEEIGRCLRDLRLARGLDVADVAQRSKRAVELIDDLEAGLLDPGLDDLQAITEALGISMAMVCRLIETAQREPL